MSLLQGSIRWLGCSQARFKQYCRYDLKPYQNRTNPASVFWNHQFVKLWEYFDPSYGLTHLEDTFIQESLSAYCYFGPDILDEKEFNGGMDLNGDGDKNDVLNLFVIYLSDDFLFLSMNGLHLKKVIYLSNP